LQIGRGKKTAIAIVQDNDKLTNRSFDITLAFAILDLDQKVYQGI